MKSFPLIRNAVAAIAFVFAGLVHAGVDTETDENGIILAGHDAVAYFTEGKPVLGDARYTAVHNNAIYRFSNAANRDAFAESPDRYAPMYGGYCAYGMTFGKKFEIDGQAFEIVGGRLFVNKNLEVYEAWKEDVPKHIVEANNEWPAAEHVAAADL